MELFIIIVILFVLWFINENTRKHRSIDKFTNGDNEVNINGLEDLIKLLKVIFMSTMHNKPCGTVEPSIDQSRQINAPEPDVVHPRHLYVPEHRVQQHHDVQPRHHDVQPRLQEFQHRLEHDLSSSSRHGTEHKNMIILDHVEAHDSSDSYHSPLDVLEADVMSTIKDTPYRGNY